MTKQAEQYKDRLKLALESQGFTLNDFEDYLQKPELNKKTAAMSLIAHKTASDIKDSLEIFKAPAEFTMEAGKSVARPLFGLGNLLGMQAYKRYKDIDESGRDSDDLEYRLERLRRARQELELMRQMQQNLQS